MRASTILWLTLLAAIVLLQVEAKRRHDDCDDDCDNECDNKCHNDCHDCDNGCHKDCDDECDNDCDDDCDECECKRKRKRKHKCGCQEEITETEITTLPTSPFVPSSSAIPSSPISTPSEESSSTSITTSVPSSSTPEVSSPQSSSESQTGSSQSSGASITNKFGTATSTSSTSSSTSTLSTTTPTSTSTDTTSTSTVPKTTSTSTTTTPTTKSTSSTSTSTSTSTTTTTTTRRKTTPSKPLCSKTCNGTCHLEFRCMCLWRTYTVLPCDLYQLCPNRKCLKVMTDCCVPYNKKKQPVCQAYILTNILSYIHPVKPQKIPYRPIPSARWGYKGCKKDTTVHICNYDDTKLGYILSRPVLSLKSLCNFGRGKKGKITAHYCKCDKETRILISPKVSILPKLKF